MCRYLELDLLFGQVLDLSQEHVLPKLRIQIVHSHSHLGSDCQLHTKVSREFIKGRELGIEDALGSVEVNIKKEKEQKKAPNLSEQQEWKWEQEQEWE